VSTTRRHLIIGAGLAGARTAEALRAAGSTERIVLVGDEVSAPYLRPPLSKDFLAGRQSRDAIDVLPEAWYRDNDVELLAGVRAVDIDTVARTVALEDGREIGYGGLLVATGSSPRRLEVPGADSDGVLMLRRDTDSTELREALASATSLIVVGGGWIGLEVASLARTCGLPVTIVERSFVPLGRMLGDEMAEVMLGMHRDHGVRFCLDATVSAIVTEGGRAAGVRLTDGEELEADLVLVAVGVTPNIALAERALEVDDGIVVDQHLRANAPDVYAAGDVASAWNPFLGRRIRVEHWANAEHQPKVVARNMLGATMRYDRLPYFYTDQYDMSMELTGLVEPDAQDLLVVRGDVDSLRFVAFWMRHGRVRAAMSSNVEDVIPAATLLIRTLAHVRAEELADPSVSLDDLVARAVAPSDGLDPTSDLEQLPSDLSPAGRDPVQGFDPAVSG
jgi:NADPH-dependent 2,4-dienoyl-CoA reductase/sulfur reductase-like enzyme